MAMDVLKQRHSMIGKSLVPVIMKLKNQNEEILPDQLARLKKDHLLTRYTLDELKADFEGLTGERLADILMLCGKEETEVNARHLLHFTILQANLVWAPRGKALNPCSLHLSGSNLPGPSGQNSGALGNPISTSSDPLVIVDCTSANTSSTCSSAQGVNTTASGLPSSEESSLLVRLKHMEDKMDVMSNKSVEKQVDDCLSHVRILCARPSITQSHVLLAAIESLVTVSTKLSHKDADFFGKAYSYCKKFEDSKDFCGLVMKLFGSAEDKKIANVVADWIKGKKYETSPIKKTVDGKENVNPVKNETSAIYPNYAQGSQSLQYSCAPPCMPSNNMFMPPYYGPPPFMPYPGGLPPMRFNRGGRGGFGEKKNW